MKNGKLTETEIKKILDKIIIIVDSREKKNQHITNYFKSNNIKYFDTETIKGKGFYKEFIDHNNDSIFLRTGDYGLFLDQNLIMNKPAMIKDIVIERKNGIDEFSGNIVDRLEEIRDKTGKIIEKKKVEKRQRFINEMKRAKENNQNFIVMFEREPVAVKCLVCNKIFDYKGKQCKCMNSNKIYLYEDFNEEILRGNFRSMIKPASYYGTVFSYKNSIEYNNKFEVIPKHLAGKFIYDTFKYHLRSRLKKYKKIKK